MIDAASFRRPSARSRQPAEGSEFLGAEEMKVLTEEEERRLIGELVECRDSLIEAISALKDFRGRGPLSREDFHKLIRTVLTSRLGSSAAAVEVKRLARKYEETRDRIALANIRLVAYAAKRYLNRGISYSDLIQEGFCGLLNGIDRFEPSNGTRLATYVLWWIKQALRRTVSADAYPVRLNPKLLRQVAIEQEDINHDAQQQQRPHLAATLKSIRCAIRPTVPFDVAFETGAAPNRAERSSSPANPERESAENGEYLLHMMRVLTPRERTVLQLRFGLGGNSAHSLSQVSEVLEVSKERIRQIQEKALQKLRDLEEVERSDRDRSIDRSGRSVRIVI
jgi:RNA polymerase sigma factor (sigma-70 family)